MNLESEQVTDDAGCTVDAYVFSMAFRFTIPGSNAAPVEDLFEIVFELGEL
jgi:hypothetical protein